LANVGATTFPSTTGGAMAWEPNYIEITNSKHNAPVHKKSIHCFHLFPYSKKGGK